jgi:hypothetical protein
MGAVLGILQFGDISGVELSGKLCARIPHTCLLVFYSVAFRLFSERQDYFGKKLL